MFKARYIIIIGCGRLGSYLANRLSRDGHSVVVIDQKEKAFSNLTADFSGFRIQGNAVELAVLKEARIEDADCVLVTATDDNVNLMVGQMAKEVFNVPQVIARVYDLKRERAYQEFGIRTISPTELAAFAFLGVIVDTDNQGKR